MNRSVEALALPNVKKLQLRAVMQLPKWANADPMLDRR
jgi:hypothetical protein